MAMLVMNKAREPQASAVKTNLNSRKKSSIFMQNQKHTAKTHLCDRSNPALIGLRVEHGSDTRY